MSRVKSGTRRRRAGFPRVSGDEPKGVTFGLENVQFSPRERG